MDDIYCTSLNLRCHRCFLATTKEGTQENTADENVMMFSCDLTIFEFTFNEKFYSVCLDTDFCHTTSVHLKGKT